MTNTNILKTWFYLWGAITIPGFLFFLYSPNYHLKEKWWKTFIWGTGLALFAGIVFRATKLRTTESLVCVALVPIGWFFLYKDFGFCSSCGTTITRYYFWLPKICRECGSEIS